MKLTKFLNAVTAEGGQVGNDFQKIKAFLENKCRRYPFCSIDEVAYRVPLINIEFPSLENIVCY